jgi:UDP-N-acetylglucosamine acyltransferase
MSQPTAFIHPEAQIAENVKIEPFAFIDKDVIIGERTWIGPNACIWQGARIGQDCQIYPGAQIAATPQDLKYKDEKTEAIIGDRTIVREHVTISRGTAARMKTLVGRDSLLMAYVHIAHDCQVGNHCIISNAVQAAGHVEIGDYAVIGGMSAIRQFVRIGAHTMIAGGSLVRKDIPPFVSAAREPLGYNGVNTIGLKRRGFEQEKLNELQEIYRTIFLGDFNTTKAIQKVKSEFPESQERNEIIHFIQASDRGIMKGLE